MLKKFKEKMRDKGYQYVSCYYCGKLTRYDKAITLYVSPKLVSPDIPDNQKPLAVLVAPKKIYVCPSCARFRGLSRKVTSRGGQDLLKKLGIEI